MLDGELDAADWWPATWPTSWAVPSRTWPCSTTSPRALPAAHAAQPGAAADALADTYLDLAGQSPVAAIAGLAAYETQAAAIAASKGDGLRRWYGVDADGTRFWDVHATMDADHGDWAVEALALLGADEAEVTEASRRAADAWWALLDEREAEGLATV